MIEIPEKEMLDFERAMRDVKDGIMKHRFKDDNVRILASCPTREHGIINFFAIIQGLIEIRGFDLNMGIDRERGCKRFYIYASNEYEEICGHFSRATTNYWSESYRRDEYTTPEVEEYKRMKLKEGKYPESTIVLSALKLSGYMDDFGDWLRQQPVKIDSKIYDKINTFRDELESFCFSESLAKKEDNKYEKEEERWNEQKTISIERQNRRCKKTYLMLDTHTGYYKIGKSENPKFREDTLLSMKPTINLIWTYKKDIEKELHRKYSEYRIRGEWFKLDESHIEEIKNYI